MDTWHIYHALMRPSGLFQGQSPINAVTPENLHVAVHLVCRGWASGRIDPFGVSMAEVGGVPAVGGTRLRWNSESMANPG